MNISRTVASQLALFFLSLLPSALAAQELEQAEELLYSETLAAADSCLRHSTQSNGPYYSYGSTCARTIHEMCVKRLGLDQASERKCWGVEFEVWNELRSAAFDALVDDIKSNSESSEIGAESISLLELSESNWKSAQSDQCDFLISRLGSGTLAIDRGLACAAEMEAVRASAYSTWSRY